jgi:hypothetical protein
MDCVNHPGIDAPYQCYRCREFMCVDCETKVEGRSYCRSCFANIHERLAARYEAETRNISYPLALVSGAAAAAVAAVVWSQMALWTGYSPHFFPLALGAAVGYGIVSCTGGKRGEKLQTMASLLTLVGCLVAFFLVALRTQAFLALGAAEFGSPVSAALSTFPTYLMQLGVLYWLFVMLGVGLAWWIPHVRMMPE